MRESIDTDEFIRRSREKHGDSYDYSDSVYVNSTTPIKIICPIHGPFYPLPYTHYNGHGCSKCGFIRTALKKTLDTNNFIEKANKIHNNFYDYSQTDYNKATEKVKIICPKHNFEFYLTPHKHLGGQGCPKCGEEEKRKNRMGTTEMFVDRAEKIHGQIYDYSNVDYQGLQSKVKIFCPIDNHGFFDMLPGNHLKGQGCPKCGVLKYVKSRTSSTDEFLNKAKELYGNLYDYSLVNYNKSDIPVDIICNKDGHGVFSVRPNNFLSGNGCPVCQESKGERNISKILTDKNIPFLRQHKFKDCVSDRKFCYKLPFDFYLPDYNSCIEYDGTQHFEEVKLFGGEEGFKRRQELDKIKDLFCKKNNINLIRIPYTMKKNDIIKYIENQLGIG
jgi:hypothetical protein